MFYFYCRTQVTYEKKEVLSFYIGMPAPTLLFYARKEEHQNRCKVTIKRAQYKIKYVLFLLSSVSNL